MRVEGCVPSKHVLDVSARRVFAERWIVNEGGRVVKTESGYIVAICQSPLAADLLARQHNGQRRVEKT